MNGNQNPRDEWKTEPADLGGWANRAMQQLQRAEKAEAELAELREAVRAMLKDHGPARDCEDDCPAHRLRQLIEEKP